MKTELNFINLHNALINVFCDLGMTELSPEERDKKLTIDNIDDWKKAKEESETNKDDTLKIKIKVVKEIGYLLEDLYWM